jgi:hypothetical protein
MGEQTEGVRARDRLRAEASIQILESRQSRALSPDACTMRPRCRSSTGGKGAVADQMR